jgi:cell shape-determining protein MreC
VGFTRSKTIWLICVLALAVLSLRPESYVERGLAIVFTPTRILAALSSPLRILDPREVLAADESQVEAERALCRRVRTAFRKSARPRDGSLAAEAVVIEAEVLQRTIDNRDRVLVKLPTTEGIEPGVPAVCGDAYVGRVVASVPGSNELAEVELVTSSTFRVGGSVQDGGMRSELIVGGLAPRHDLSSRILHLAVHNPSNRKVSEGLVRVAEPEALALDDEDSRLADGFLLGELREFEARHKKAVSIRPALDFEAGLFHLALLVPLERAPARIPALEDLFAAEAWREGQMLLAGELSPWRAGRKLTVPDHDNLARGAAVIVGARFVGRVESVGTTLIDVRLLSDPGLVVPALALVHGDEAEELVVLGSLVSMGRNEAGKVVLRWETDRPLAADAAFGEKSVEALLFTGSGQRGVPLGLRIGEVSLPTGAGVHRLELEHPRIGSDRVQVRRVTEEGPGS